MVISFINNTLGVVRKRFSDSDYEDDQFSGSEKSESFSSPKEGRLNSR